MGIQAEFFCSQYVSKLTFFNCLNVEKKIDSQSQLRKSILEYAWTEFCRIGIKKVKVDDLSAHFSISKRTLYEMFEDKEHLVLACFIHMFDHTREKVQQVRAESTNSFEVYIRMFILRMNEIENVNPVFFVDLFKYPKLTAFLNQNTQERNDIVLNVISQCVEEGFMIPNLNYRMLLEMMDFEMLNIIKFELFKKYSMAEILNSLQVITFRGCCTAKGLQLIDSYLMREHNKNLK